jgi:hypothetical protein
MFPVQGPAFWQMAGLAYIRGFGPRCLLRWTRSRPGLAGSAGIGRAGFTLPRWGGGAACTASLPSITSWGFGALLACLVLERIWYVPI